MTKLRVATTEDIPRLTQLMQAFHKEGQANGLSPSPFSAARVETMLLGAMAAEEQFVIVATHQDRPIGLLWFLFMQPIFSEELVCSEVSWYILPKYRKGTLAIKMLKAMQSAAKEAGAVRIAASHFADMPGAGKIYERVLKTKPYETTHMGVL